MKIAFLVNEIKTEESKYTTIRLAMAATNMGHEAWLICVSDLSYDVDDTIRAKAYRPNGRKYKSSDNYFKDLLSNNKSVCKRILVDDLDVLFLRNDPSAEPSNRSWARNTGIEFGRLAAKKGVIVLNDPTGLSNATNKMYFQQFPKEVRVKTIITRDKDEIKKFSKQYKKFVIKPLSGSGGRNVFLVTPENLKNLNQMIDAVSRDGYIVVQEYLPLASEGDIRLFLLNGMPLKCKDKYAAFRRISSKDDVRSNLHAGGKIKKVIVDNKILKIAEIVRPKLVKDGMFLVGLDIVGDKILEINVFTPGGLGTAQKLEKVDFTQILIRSIEKKVQYMKYYKRRFSNTEMAIL
jgi:glutathione synthase